MYCAKIRIYLLLKTFYKGCMYVCMYVYLQKRNEMSLKSIRWRYFRQKQAKAGIHVPRSHAPLNHIKLVNVQNYFKIKGNLAAMVNHVRRQAKSNNKSKGNNKGYYFGQKKSFLSSVRPFSNRGHSWIYELSCHVTFLGDLDTTVLIVKRLLFFL